MKKTLKMIGVALGSLLLFFGFLWFNNNIGISKNFIEEDARRASKIADDWSVAIDTSDVMSAMVFYPKDKSDYYFQVYVNRPGLSFGYFFRGGGNIVNVKGDVTEFSVEGYEDSAFISLNTQQVTRMEIDDGNNVETVEIERTKPFAFVLENDIEAVTFFDVNGCVVEAMMYPL